MNQNLILIIFANIFCSTTHTIIFMGITENGISKNGFICRAVSASAPCKNLADQYVGFDMKAYQTIQIFKPQAYWLTQAGKAQDKALQLLGYTPDNVQDYLDKQGWSAMGDYCLLITTNQVATNILAPDLKAKEGFIKIVAQLFYAGDNLLQLWSQDSILAPENSSFQIDLSNQEDTALTQTKEKIDDQVTNKMLTSFLQAGKIARIESTYNGATENPRSIKIIVTQ